MSFIAQPGPPNMYYIQTYVILAYWLPPPSHHPIASISICVHSHSVWLVSCMLGVVIIILIRSTNAGAFGAWASDPPRSLTSRKSISLLTKNYMINHNQWFTWYTIAEWIMSWAVARRWWQDWGLGTMTRGKQVPVVQLQWRTYSQWVSHNMSTSVSSICVPHFLSGPLSTFHYVPPSPGSHVILAYTQQFAWTWRLGGSRDAVGRHVPMKSCVCTFHGHCARLTHMLHMFSGGNVWFGYCSVHTVLFLNLKGGHEIEGVGLLWEGMYHEILCMHILWLLCEATKCVTCLGVVI